jgi:hypothetical protein
MLQFISGRLISFGNLFIYVNNSQYIVVVINYCKLYMCVNVKMTANI